MEGTIAMVSDKGFGFIKVEGRDKDLFFHQTECVGDIFKSLKRGSQVVFESIGQSPKGETALGVSLV